MMPKHINGVIESLLISVAPKSREFARGLLKLAYRQGVSDCATFLDELYTGKHGGSAYGLSDRLRKIPDREQGERYD